MKLRNKMSKYKGLFTFDEENHRYVPIAQADGLIDSMDYEPDSKPAEPLIKDEKIRKAVRAWAEVLEENTIRFDRVSQGFSFGDGNVYSSINFDGLVFNLVDGKKYTIAELCGEKEK